MLCGVALFCKPKRYGTLDTNVKTASSIWLMTQNLLASYLRIYVNNSKSKDKMLMAEIERERGYLDSLVVKGKRLAFIIYQRHVTFNLNPEIQGLWCCFPSRQ